MRRTKAKKTVLLLLTVFLTGCAFGKGEPDTRESKKKSGNREISEVQENSESIKEENEISSMETEPELSYEVPANVPNICVNQLGYITTSNKTAIFFGEELPEEFHVVREESGDVVFNGYLTDKGYNTVRQEYNGYGDFSEVEESGTYYIEAPMLGRSYSFMIGDDLYENVFKESCKRDYQGLHDTMESPRESDAKEDALVVEVAREMAISLLAFELNPDVFTDDMGISESGNEIPDLLDEIRYKAEWLLKMQEVEAEEAYAMALAKFSYLYQSYDTEFATECLKAADIAWKQADLNEEADNEDSKDGWKFAAATELYRASGKQSYHAYVTEYLSEGSYCEKKDLSVLSGCVTYISTRQKVNISFCEEITKMLTTRADEAAKRMENVFSRKQEEGNSGEHQELLEESIYLILINHMTISREYELVIENCLHYLMGRNGQMISYIDNVGEHNYRLIDENMGITSKPEGNSRLILLLSDILSWQREHNS